MTASALRVTGLRVEGDTLLHHGREVPTVRLREALSQFLDWLRNVSDDAGGRKPLLLSYNGYKYDVPVLKNAFNKSGSVRLLKQMGLFLYSQCQRRCAPVKGSQTPCGEPRARYA